jgi:hypothetical protein
VKKNQQRRSVQQPALFVVLSRQVFRDVRAGETSDVYRVTGNAIRAES